MSMSSTEAPVTAEPDRTLTDLHNPGGELGNPSKGIQNPDTQALGTLGSAEENMAKGQATEVSHPSNALASLPSGKKNTLTVIFCLAFFIDAAGVSATFLMTAPISSDLHISASNEAWVLGTYSITFAAFLLFAGRVADLYRPHQVYTLGFIGIAIFYLVISFMTDQYAFFVLRAFSGLFAVLTIPSSINMIIQMFPDPGEQTKRLAFFGLAGALANTLALVLAGVFLLASWRWYFRFVTIVVVPFAALAWYLMPTTTAVAEDLPGAEKWKRMDLGGVAILVAGLILFILGFTQAPTNGWNSAIFIAPFVVAIFLMAIFIVWEHYRPRGYSLLPPGVWSYPNIYPLLLQASSIFLWFATAQLRLATYFQDALGDSAILAAVKLLPQGVTALIVGVAAQAAPWLITRPNILFAFSHGGPGKDYWKFLFPGEVIGTAGGIIIFISMNTAIIQAFPLEYAGIGGSVANVIFQIGGIIGIAVQAGLLETGDGTIQDWVGSQNSYYFSGAYILVTGIIIMFWYKQEKMPENRHT